jgi:uncharacterized membrane protein
MSEQPTTHALACPACRTIDKADGVEDGRLYRTVAPRVKDERWVVRGLRDAQDVAADRITSFAGSMPFVYLHGVWFALWIVINLGALGASLVFDKFPFGLLTMVVSLEAIYLSTFVMITQNRQSERAEVRAEIDFENNVRGEVCSVHIGHALGLDVDHVEHIVGHIIDGYRAEQTLHQQPPKPAA